MRWVSFTDRASSIHCISEPHYKIRKTQTCSTGNFTHGETSGPASSGSGRSVLIQAGSRQMHSNIHAQHLTCEESWAVAKKSRDTWAACCGGSLRTQPKLPDCGGSTVTMQKQTSISVPSETSGDPVALTSVWQHFQVMSPSHYSGQ